MTKVYDETAALSGTNDGGTDQGVNFRVLISSSLLSAAGGSKGTITLIMGNNCTAFTGSATLGINPIFFGQASGVGNSTTSPAFTGDQIQLFFSGNAFPGAYGNSAVFTTDSFTLGESWNSSQNYMLSWFVLSGTSAAYTQSQNTGLTGATSWFLSGGSAGGAGQTAALTSTQQTTTLYILQQINIGGGHAIPLLGAGSSSLSLGWRASLGLGAAGIIVRNPIVKRRIF